MIMNLSENYKHDYRYKILDYCWKKLGKKPLTNAKIYSFNESTYGSPTIFGITSNNHKNIVYMGWQLSNTNIKINTYLRLIFLKGLDFIQKDMAVYVFVYSKKQFDLLMDSFVYCMKSKYKKMKKLNRYTEVHPKNEELHQYVEQFLK